MISAKNKNDINMDITKSNKEVKSHHMANEVKKFITGIAGQDGAYL